MAVEYLTFSEALEELQVDEEELKRIVSSAELRAFRTPGGGWKFRRVDLVTLKEGRRPRVRLHAPGPVREPDGSRARDVVVAPHSPVAASDRHAVIVGVGRFSSASVSALPCAERDARDLHDVLTDPTRAGIDAGNVKLLLGADATLDAVKRALGVFLERSAAEDDLVLLYFATHGIVQRNEGYLLLHDSDPASPFQSALRMGELASILGSLSTGNVVLILDACHAGATTPSEAWFRVLDGFGASAGSRVVLAACGAAEQSLELDGDANGLFTKHLLAGLRGEADRGRKGAIGVEDLFSYVRDQVHDDAARLGRQQTPSWWGKVQAPMLLTQDPVGQGPEPGKIHRRGVPRLLVLDDVGPRVRLRLTGKCTTIGRHPDCDVQLMGDRGVSRDHAQIERTHGAYVLTTQAPSNRTARNGVPIPPGQTQQLADGDELRLGSTKLVFLWDGAPSPSETGNVETPATRDVDADILQVDVTSEPSAPIGGLDGQADGADRRRVFRCPGCGKGYKVGARQQGKRFVCRRCKAKHMIPRGLFGRGDIDHFEAGARSDGVDHLEAEEGSDNEMQVGTELAPGVLESADCQEAKADSTEPDHDLAAPAVTNTHEDVDDFELTQASAPAEALAPEEALDERDAPAGKGRNTGAVSTSPADAGGSAGSGLFARAFRALNSLMFRSQRAPEASYMLVIDGLDRPERWGAAWRIVSAVHRLSDDEGKAFCRGPEVVVIDDGAEHEVEHVKTLFEDMDIPARIVSRQPETTPAPRWSLFLLSRVPQAEAWQVVAEARGCSIDEARVLCMQPHACVLDACPQGVVLRTRQRLLELGISTRLLRVSATGP